MAIELPNSKSKEVEDGKAAESEKTPVDEVASKLAALTEEFAQLNKERREKQEAAKKEEEEEEQQRLAAESNLEELFKNEKTSEDTSVDKRVNDLDNTELLDVVANAVDTAITARFEMSNKDVDKKFKETAESMGKIIKLLGQMNASAGMDRLKSKYPDFEKYGNDTMTVLEKYPMMDIEDAHLLARKIREGDSAPRSQTEFERPFNVPFEGAERTPEPESGREVEREETPKSDSKSGVTGFRNILRSALSKRYGS